MYSFIDSLQEINRIISEKQQQNTVRGFYIDRLCAVSITGYYAIIFKLTSDNKLELCYKIKDEKEFDILINCLDKPDNIYKEKVCGYVNSIPFILVN